MGGISRSKSSSSSGSASSNMADAQSQVGQSTQAGTNDWLTGLMGNQSSMIGSVLTPLIEAGTQQMNSNPGMQNFMSKTGARAQELGQSDWLQNFAEAARGWAPTPQQPQAQPGQQSPFYFSGLDENERAKYNQYLNHQAKYGR